MDKFVQYLFLVLIPFYPLWAWFSTTFAKLYINKIVILIFLPIAVYYVIVQKYKFPKYLLFLVLFTIYHLGSIYINNLLPLDTNWLYYILSDYNVLACFVLFIVENTRYDLKFIHKLNRCIFAIIIIALLVSIIQIRYPYFFVNPILKGKEYIHYIEQGRNFSIFSWIDLNTLGHQLPHYDLDIA